MGGWTKVFMLEQLHETIRQTADIDKGVSLGVCGLFNGIRKVAVAPRLMVDEWILGEFTEEEEEEDEETGSAMKR